MFLASTHSRDRGCGCFGVPIYHQARKLIAELGLQNTRIWQASHIGCHPMASTTIDLVGCKVKP